MRGYLLGDLTDAEREALEREYFADPGFFERLVQAENELMDSYARGLLTPDTRARFERHYLAHPARRGRAEFARALAATLERRGPPPPETTGRVVPLWLKLLGSVGGPKLAWAFSASLLLAGAVAAWVYMGTGRQQREVASAGVERATPEQVGGEARPRAGDERPGATGPEPGPHATPGVREKVQPLPTPAAKAAPVVATLVLTAGGIRGAEAGPPASLLLTTRTEQVSLRLKLSEADYQSYGGVLRRAGGGEVFSWRRLPARAAKSGKTVSLVMPARRLAEGDYVLTLRGTRDTGEPEDVSVSFFHVERR